MKNKEFDYVLIDQVGGLNRKLAGLWIQTFLRSLGKLKSWVENSELEQ